MSGMEKHRGAAPVGFLTELDGLEAAAVIYLRLWCDGPEARAEVCSDLQTGLGQARGTKAIKAFEQLCMLCTTHGRRPLMRHGVKCKCLGADESCFANFVATAAEGDREDAMLMATLLVRVDMAPLITALAIDFGLSLKQMRPCAPRELDLIHVAHPTVH